jgi:GNAT superfamily N-acetyltransferase
MRMASTAEMVERMTLCEVEHVSPSTRVFAAFYVGDGFAMPMGGLTVDKDLDYVELVFVQEENRRMGVATALLNYAREVTGLRLDYDGGDRSDAGQAFAEAMGLRCQGRRRKFDNREAEAHGNRLMVQLWGAYPGTVEAAV